MNPNLETMLREAFIAGREEPESRPNVLRHKFEPYLQEEQ